MMPAEKPPRRRRGARAEERRGEPRLWTLDPRGFGRLLRYRRHRNGEGARRALETGARDPARGERERDKPRPPPRSGGPARRRGVKLSRARPPPGKYPRVSAAGSRQRRRTTTPRWRPRCGRARRGWRRRTRPARPRRRWGEPRDAGEARARCSRERGRGRDPRWNDRREDKSESFGKKKKAETLARVSAAEASGRTKRHQYLQPRPRGAGSNRVVFFSLALPLPSYAVRHVLDAKGVVAKLHMSRGGAIGGRKYAEAEEFACRRRRRARQGRRSSASSSGSPRRRRRSTRAPGRRRGAPGRRCVRGKRAARGGDGDERFGDARWCTRRRRRDERARDLDKDDES